MLGQGQGGPSLSHDKGSMMYSLGTVPQSQRSNPSRIDGTQQRTCLPPKDGQSSAMFVVNPAQNLAQARPANNMAQPQPQQRVGTNSYINLTSWTTRLSSPDSPSFPPPSAEFLSVPMMAGQQFSLPVTTASCIPLTSRKHKATPYSNPFSRMSPLQPKSVVTKATNFHGSQPDATATVLPMNSSGELVTKSIASRANRFKRTAEALHKSGLWNVAMKTGNLIKRNQELQKELDQFKMDALNFLKSVIKNPENRYFIKTVLNNALSAGATECKKSSVMTVVVSAAAAAAAIKYENSSENDLSIVSDSIGSGLGSDGMGSGACYSGSAILSGTLSDNSASCMSSDNYPNISSAGFSNDTSIT